MHDVMYSLVAPPPVGRSLPCWSAASLVFWTGLAVFDRGSEDIGELL